MTPTLCEIVLAGYLTWCAWQIIELKRIVRDLSRRLPPEDGL